MRGIVAVYDGERFKIIWSGADELLPARSQYGEAYPPDSDSHAYETKAEKERRRRRKLKEEKTA